MGILEKATRILLYTIQRLRKSSMSAIRGILLDIDGVLHISMHPIPGAAQTLEWLAQQGYRSCFVTNTTTLARATLARRLQEVGLPIPEENLVTAPAATPNYIRQH